MQLFFVHSQISFHIVCFVNSSLKVTYSEELNVEEENGYNN
jgi:hypothetical protein